MLPWSIQYQGGIGSGASDRTLNGSTQYGRVKLDNFILQLPAIIAGHYILVDRHLWLREIETWTSMRNGYRCTQMPADTDVRNFKVDVGIEIQSVLVGGNSVPTPKILGPERYSLLRYGIRCVVGKRQNVISAAR